MQVWSQGVPMGARRTITPSRTHKPVSGIDLSKPANELQTRNRPAMWIWEWMHGERASEKAWPEMVWGRELL